MAILQVSVGDFWAVPGDDGESFSGVFEVTEVSQRRVFGVIHPAGVETYFPRHFFDDTDPLGFQTKFESLEDGLKVVVSPNFARLPEPDEDEVVFINAETPNWPSVIIDELERGVTKFSTNDIAVKELIESGAQGMLGISVQFEIR